MNPHLCWVMDTKIPDPLQTNCLQKPRGDSDFLEFVLFKYTDPGVGELYQAKLPELIQHKYSSISNATEVLGGVDEIRTLFMGFQKYLYDQLRDRR